MADKVLSGATETYDNPRRRAHPQRVLDEGRARSSASALPETRLPLPRCPALRARRAVVHGLASGLVNFLRCQQRDRLEMDGITRVDS